MIRFISRFNKEEVYAHIHQEIFIKFKLHFTMYLNKTCVATYSSAFGKAVYDVGGSFFEFFLEFWHLCKGKIRV